MKEIDVRPYGVKKFEIIIDGVFQYLTREELVVLMTKIELALTEGMRT